MGMDNIFMHDAVPTWSGFLYQGRIAVYLAVRKINELREAGNESEIKKYALEMEKCEDIAVVYMVLSVKLDAPVPCRLDAPDLDLICYASADCLHQHLQVI